MALLIRFWQRLHERFLPSSHRRNIAAARRAIPRLRVLAEQFPGRCFHHLRGLDPLVFEELVLELYAMRGYRIRRNRRYSGDGGIDGWVKHPTAPGKAAVWAPIQCKRYGQAINPQHVADFRDLLRRQKRPLGLFVHTGRTGNQSRMNAGEGIRFVSGDNLLDLLKR